MYLIHWSLLIYRPLRDGWLSWPCWLTNSGRLTHKVIIRPASSQAQDRESSPVKDQRSTTVLPLCLHCKKHIVRRIINHNIEETNLLEKSTIKFHNVWARIASHDNIKIHQQLFLLTFIYCWPYALYNNHKKHYGKCPCPKWHAVMLGKYSFWHTAGTNKQSATY